jgi:HK97 family phage major capsid protein
MTTAQTILDLFDIRADDARKRAEQIATRAQTENRGLNAAELIEFDAATAELTQITQRAAELRAQGVGGGSAPSNVEQRMAAATTPPARVGGAIIRNEPQTYRRGGEFSLVKDHTMRALGSADNATLDRLQRHAREFEVEVRAGSTGDTAGGTFVPPLWLVDEFVGVQRPGRATADLARQMTLGAGTDSINVPTVTTGTVTDVQATENSAATTRDMVTSSTNADVTTIAGTYDFSLQQLEQSALAYGWDQLVFGDLLRDHNRVLDTLVLAGTGTNNQPWGLSTVAATSVTASSTSSTTAQNQIYGAVADAIHRISTTRYDTPEVIIMHPRRWFWLCSRLDLDGRPVIVPDPQAGQSMLASAGITSHQGVVGTMIGLPVVIDANVTTSAGTSEDRIYVWKASDAILFQGLPKFEVFRSIGGATTDSLTARARLYSYNAFSSRFSTATALVGGSALSSPTF